MPKIGTGDIKFQGITFDDGRVAIAICHHKPSCVGNKFETQHYLSERHVDDEEDFSLVVDLTGERDTFLVFRCGETLDGFSDLVATIQAHALRSFQATGGS